MISVSCHGYNHWIHSEIQLKNEIPSGIPNLGNLALVYKFNVRGIEIDVQISVF